MKTYISFLRGINVGGHRKILMADLRLLYTQLGFTNVQSYIQSGNLSFQVSKETSTKQIEQKIHRAIENQYGYDVPVVIRTQDQLQKALKGKPFKGMDDQFHLIFLSELPSDEDVESLRQIKYPPDKIEIIGKHIYLFCEGKFHTTKFSINLFEKKLKVRATARNWRTLKKMAEL